MIQAEKMIMMSKKQYTLTISTNPASATCTLTYNGNSYSSKTCTVDEGTVVSYSIYHSTYGTKTGSVTINSDKTITATGTYSTSTTYNTSWSAPHNLTSNSSDPTFQTSCSTLFDNRYAAWKCFDGLTNTSANGWLSASKNLSGYIICSLNTKVKLTSVTAYGYGVYGFQHLYVYGGNTSSGSWTYLFGHTSTGKNDYYANYNSCYVSGNPSTAYQYFKIYGENINYNRVTGFSEVYMSGYTGTTSYTYYWDISTN